MRSRVSRVGTAYRADASCRLDTHTADNGPVQVKATVESSTGETTSAVRPVNIRNDPPSSTHYMAPKWFSSTSFWNRELAVNAPISPNSDENIAELTREVSVKPAWINTSFCSVPVYTVGPDQPMVHVTYRPNIPTATPYPPTQEALNAVPVPARAQPAAGLDKHMVIWQPSTDKMWEFWHMEENDGEWSAQAAGAMEHVSQNEGRYGPEAWSGAQPWWGATGTSLPLVGGLITVEELQHRSINHAIAMAIPEPSPAYVWPARRSDGANSSSAAIPEGTIFRLPPTLDLRALHLSPPTLAIAEAAQKFGMVVRDETLYNVVLYGEDPTSGGSDPYPAIYEGRSPSELLNEFPWGKLEVVAPPS